MNYRDLQNISNLSQEILIEGAKKEHNVLNRWPYTSPYLQESTELDEEDKTGYGIDTYASKKYFGDNEKQEKLMRRMNRLSGKKQETQKEEVDLYDIILSHLLDEGYAETPEQAEVIMVNMSEEWRESICEGMKSIIDKKFPNRKYKIGIPDRNIEPDVIEDPETGYPVKKNKLRKLTRDEQKRKN
jgi:hypothetical protein